MTRFDRRFVPLHLPSDFSFLRSMNTVATLLSEARRRRLFAAALTDLRNLHGAMRFHRAALAEGGFKPLLGLEVPVAVHGEIRHAVLLAENRAGWRRLVALSEPLMPGTRSLAPEELCAANGGTVLLCGGPDGLLAALDDAERRDLAGALRDAYGDRFYIEVYWHGLPDEKAHNADCLRLADALGIPAVATDPARYREEEERDAFACLVAPLPPRERDRLLAGDRAMKPVDRMEKLYGHRPDLLSRTLEVAERCTVAFDFPPLSMPRYPVPPDFTEASLLRKTALDRLPPGRAEGDPYRERLERELAAIEARGFSGYFLIVRDIVEHARRRGLFTGPGRGSVCGSLVAYLTGVTEIDPVEHGLLFERFLNAERGDLPDIDIDVPHDRRIAVLQHIAERFAPERVAQIASFGTFRAKAALREAARHLGASGPRFETLVARLGRSDEALADAFSRRADPADRRLAEGEFARVVKAARPLLGRVHNRSIHAAGVVIVPAALAPDIPFLARQGDEGLPVAAWDMDDLAAIGLVKFDVLAVKALTVIGDTLERARLRLAPREADLAQPKVYRMIGEGRTFGVFQLESAEMRRFLRRLKPANFAELVDGIALFRPGPLSAGMADAYLERRPPEFPESVRDLLAPTRGVLVYQEQVMEIARRVAGFTLERADALREAMAKKRAQSLEAMAGGFLEGARELGHAEEEARRVFESLARFGEYGFNKSHAAAYALLAYLTAWLKALHPHHYLAALLGQDLGDASRLEEGVREALRLGVRVLPPSVNGPLRGFRSARGAITFPLAALRGAGEHALRELEAARGADKRFDSLEAFLAAVRDRPPLPSLLPSLVKCGALDAFGVSRKGLLLHLSGEPLESARAMDEFADEDLRDDEIALLGVHLSAAPEEAHALLRRAMGCIRPAEAAGAPDGAERILLARLRRGRGGILEARDGDESLPLRTVAGVSPDGAGLHAVRARLRDGAWHAERIRPMEDLRHAAAVTLALAREAAEGTLPETLFSLLRDHRGLCPLAVEIARDGGAPTRIAATLTVLLDEALLSRLSAFGEAVEVRVDPFPEANA